MSDKNSLPDNAKMVFKGKIFDIWQWEQKMYDGSTKTFERIKRPNTIEVIAAVGDKIIVQDEEQPDSPDSFVTLPCGRCEEGEDPLESAKRELLEETGYSSDDWVLLQEFHPGRKMIWTIYTYVARNCMRTAEPHLDAGERIKVRLASFDDILMLSEEPLFRSANLTEIFLRARLDTKKKEELSVLLFKGK